MIALILSEIQTLRNFFLSNNWSALPRNQKYLFICSIETFEIIKELSSQNRIPVVHQIIQPELLMSKKMERIIGAMRLFSGSPSVYKNIKKNKVEGLYSFYKYLLCIFIFNLYQLLPVLSKLFRFILLKLNYNSRFRRLFNTYSIDIVISLAITNHQDALILISAKLSKIPTIATTRSWDNLSSHGSLMVEPDIFIQHSKFMEDQFLTFQNLSNGVSKFRRRMPWYDTNEFFPNSETTKGFNSTANYKILYACTGPTLFPNELTYVSDLINKLDGNFFTIKILQHPKDKHTLNGIIDYNLIDGFPYVDQSQNSTLIDYYQYIDQFDLVIGSGSTVLLDSYYRKKLIIAFLPNNSASFWSDISRYGDYMYHYKIFLKLNEITIFQNVKDIVDFISNFPTIKNQKILHYDYFLGAENDFSLSFQPFIDHFL